MDETRLFPQRVSGVGCGREAAHVVIVITYGSSARNGALGLGLAELVNLLDPEAVVVGGGLGSATGHYWDSAVAAARSAIWADVSRDVPLLQATIGPPAGVVGAALISRIPLDRRWISAASVP